MYVGHLRKNLAVKSGLVRKLHLETLEDRRMLAVMLVTDLGDGSLASLSGDGQLSLREAVEAINTAAPVDGIGPLAGSFGLTDTIIFVAPLFGGTSQTLSLTAGPLELSSSVTVFGPGSSTLTLDANQNSRVFDITASDGGFVIAQMTLTGGLTTGVQQSGGAVRSMTTDPLIFRNVVMNENATTGDSSNGGAVSAVGLVTIFDSSFTNNRTENSGSGGGGIFSLGDISLTGSTVADNRTEGIFANGAGVSSGGNVTLNSSTVSGNRTLGGASSAGGILASGDVTLVESTVSGNQTFGNSSSGGGVSSGGMITVTRSTIVNNQTLGANASGGGIQTITSDIVVSGSIIANNTAGGGNADIQPGTGTLTVDHSLLGDATGLGIAAATNLLNVTPLLGPLAGGGSTKTHAPLPGSPVIDAGDALVVSPPAFDQRGVPFSRIANGDSSGSAVIDIGAHEVQAPANADFDGDNDVDGADFLAWQRGFGKVVDAVHADGNSDEDTDVDGHDLAVWKIQFGETAVSFSAPKVQAMATEDRASLIDLAIAVELGNTEAVDSSFVSLLQPRVKAESSLREEAFATISLSAHAAAIEVDILASEKASHDSADHYEGLNDELVVVAL